MQKTTVNLVNELLWLAVHLTRSDCVRV